MAGTTIVGEQIEAYITERHRAPLPPLLTEIHAFAKEHRFPIVGPDVGTILFMLARSRGARRVFELGSGFGYSALWFATALPKDGLVVCTDGDADNVARGKDYLKRAGLAKKVRWHCGDAVTALRGDDEPNDIYFMDIDKHGYPDGFREVFPRMRPGDLFITDNVLWSGAVLDASDETPATRGIRRHTKLLFDEPSLVTTILPVRDGVAVALKVEPGKRPFASILGG